MTQHPSSSSILAAAELADHYIELILSTQPELLVADMADADAEDIVHGAQRLALYRQSLIEELQTQALPNDFDADLEEDFDADFADPAEDQDSAPEHKS